LTRNTKTVNGQSAIMIENKNSQTTSYFFSKGSNLYQITGTAAKADYATVFNQIVSSFTLN
ncbi:MAG: hypothetical protein ACHQVK_04800, partial [Candidatus Paceibacterales bacterium]